jgi:PAS domain S-box-containing protein
MRDHPSNIRASVVAIVAVLAAWGIRVLLDPVLNERVPFITFFPMIFALAWWGGLRPTVIATLLSALVVAYAIIEPRWSFSIAISEYRYSLVIYVLIGLATGVFGEQLHFANWRARQATEKAINDRERLRVTLASIGDAVIVTDELGQVASMNAVAEKLTGWFESLARGKPLAAVFQIVNEDTGQRVDDPCTKVLATGRVVGLANHTLLISRDGTRIPIDDSAAPILETSGKIRGVVLVFRDVTEKRGAEKALARSQSELADFFENSSMPLHSIAPDGTILRANQAELDMLGYAREEYVGRNIADFHIDRAAFEDILAKQFRGEALQNYETRLRCKDGTIKDVVIAASALWEDGEFVHTRCFTRDISDQKSAEQALKFLAAASASLATLADRESALQQAVRLPIPFLADWCVIYVVDEHGAIDYHAHAHCDPQKERLLGEMLHKFPLDWNSNTATVRALRTGKSQLMEELPEPLLSSFTQSDEHREIVRVLNPHAVISVPLKIRERTIGVIGLVASDSSRRYSRRELEIAESLAQRVATAVENARLFHAVKEASRQKDEFLAMLAHELRNPLAAIRYAVALGQMSHGESATEMFEIIDRQTQNLAHLIEDLLDVSRISRDKIKLRKEHVTVATIVNRVAATVRPLIDEKNHELTIDVPSEPMWLHVDPTRTEQILANLLTNAAKYTKSGGRVTVQSYSEKGDAVINVIDSGVGLPPEMLGRVFDLFAQADRTLDRAEGGLGIGLTVARKLAEMHGGSISATSEGLGNGATFTVRLPMTDAPAEPSNVRSPAPRPLRIDNNYKILVVDDNRDTASSCAMLLRKGGHEVHMAHDGLSALEMARNLKPQAIFLDIGLPGMNGFDVAKTLRDEGFANELIVAVSGYGQPEDRQRSQNAGFDQHLVKPVPQDVLLAALEGVGQKSALAS